MAEQTVRVGVIGAGRFTQRVILPQLAKMPGVELIAVGNSSEGSSAKVAGEFGFDRIARRWQDIVEATDIDAVIVGTRTDQHEQMISPILEAGKHLLTMNALARTADEARAMCATANAHADRVALVYPAVVGSFYYTEDALVRRLLQDGYVGEVLQVHNYWHTPFFGLGSMFESGHRWFGEHTRVFGYRKAFTPGATAPATAAALEAPAARAVRPQSSLALAELSSGGTIAYLHSTVAGAAARGRIEIAGSEGSVVCYPAGEEFAGCYGSRGGRLEPLPVPPDLAELLASGAPVEADFIAAVRGQRAASPAIPRFHEALRMLEFTEGWRDSADSGTWRDLPPA
ncbi:MAG: Gfo/Idh/MocA family oxidoreductase [Dehalococcoidia bacterium]|nr:Gfo/Idh/MocA family oxidoreductase [Dehalococcoidia bacterium]